MKEHEDKNGGFVFAYMKMNSTIKEYFPTLIKSDYSRLIYLSSFIGWGDGILRYDNGIRITRKNLWECLNLSKKRTSAYLKKLIDIHIIHEDDEGLLHMNPKLFYYGRIKDNIHMSKDKDTDYTRIFRGTIRKLYNKYCTGKELGRLSMVYLILPYVNLNGNIVCYNPYEKDFDLFEPMGINDLCKALGYDSTKRLKQALCSIVLDDEEAFIFLEKSSTKHNNRIIVNPNILFAGDYEQLKVVKAMFK